MLAADDSFQREQDADSRRSLRDSRSRRHHFLLDERDENAEESHGQFTQNSKNQKPKNGYVTLARLSQAEIHVGNRLFGVE